MSETGSLQSLSVIHVDFDIWSGQTRLTAADLKLGEGGKIPPEKIAQLGSKKICDPAKLKGFHRLKTETRRLLLRCGMPFMNGFAVPLSKADEMGRKLSDIRLQFNQLKQEFINGYNQVVDEWCQENPEYEQAIRTGTLPRETVEKRIGFEYQVFRIQPVNEDEASTQGLNRKVQCLGDDLIDEVVQEANRFYLERLAGRNQCAVTTRQTLRNIRDKVDGLSFLNSAFTPLVRLLDQTLRGYGQHANGRSIVAPFFYQVVATALIMSERTRIEQYANGAITLEAVAQDIGGTQTHSADCANGAKAKQESGNAAEFALVMSAGKSAQQMASTVDFVHSVQTHSASHAVDLDEDINDFFENFAEHGEHGEGGSEDSANAEDEPQEDPASRELPATDDDDCFF